MLKSKGHVESASLIIRPGIASPAFCWTRKQESWPWLSWKRTDPWTRERERDPHPSPQASESWPRYYGHRIAGSSPHLRGQFLLSYHPGQHAGPWVGPPQIYPIYDLLECTKELTLWNNSHRISITQGNTRKYEELQWWSSDDGELKDTGLDQWLTAVHILGEADWTKKYTVWYTIAPNATSTKEEMLERQERWRSKLVFKLLFGGVLFGVDAAWVRGRHGETKRWTWLGQIYKSPKESMKNYIIKKKKYILQLDRREAFFIEFSTFQLTLAVLSWHKNS